MARSCRRRGLGRADQGRRIAIAPSSAKGSSQAAVRAFVLTAGGASGEAMRQAFVAALRQMRTLIAQQAPPFIATVSATGGVALVVT
jgi:hypothetical protein